MLRSQDTDIMELGTSRRSIIAGAAALTLASAGAKAAEPGRSDKDMVSDWPWLGRYASDNERIKREGRKVDIVFIGDSITEIWKHKRPGFFPDSRINRGIGGQTSPQILLRMMPDVIAHRPKIVHILAGTNDVAGNTGAIDEAATVNNILAMVQLAKANGIKPVVGTIPPAAAFFWRPEIKPVEKIREINRRLKAASKTHHFSLVDYYDVLASPEGALPAQLGADGVHPDVAGYDRMERLLIQRISKFAIDD
ncbi:GDSL-type esterase/lipase family protein [Sphingorhabdus sp.]|uniref:GDSL-type esterase/lipase family protein n=3 Tax=Sphingorhabdus sp. TaxID=1902408 RepID=UPI003C756B32